jgi:hypothetical protein
VWLTGDEFEQIGRQIHEILRPYEDRRGIAGERQYTAVQMLFETPTPADVDEDQGAATPSAPAIPAQPKRSRVIVVGALHYSRRELERVIGEGRVLDVTVLGVCAFDSTISAELVDRAIVRFRHRGALHAPPAVRDLLQRKALPVTP